MTKLKNILFNTRTMSILVVLFFVSMAVATFVENDYGTPTAQALIYKTWWFELIMFLLAVNFIGNVFKYKLYKLNKWPVFVFHIAFLMALLGAFVTRYFGYEGTMSIREDAISNTILSDETYVDVVVDDGKDQFNNPLSKEVLFGSLSNNYFEFNTKFHDKPILVKFNKYVSNAMLSFVEDEKMDKQLHLVLSTNQGREELYIPQGTTKEYANTLFSYNHPVKGAMNFVESNNGLTLQASQLGTYMEMQSREIKPVVKDSIARLHLKHLYSFQSMNFVVVDPPKRGAFHYVTAPKNKVNQFPNHALFLDVSAGEKSKQIIVLGRKNAVSKPAIVHINGLNFKINYGSKEIKTPFSIKLRDFQLDRYPGSNSPSSFASEITVMDRDTTFDYRIFMNHVLDYKGYRFFQSNYDPDEKGTVLSVNHDFWGTSITYLGYMLMAIGMFFSMFLGKSRFRKLSKSLKKSANNKVSIFLVLLSLSSSLWSQEQEGSIKNYTVSHEHANQFGQLLIQDFQGRVKPINSYALEVLRKIYKKDTYKGLSAEQVLLSTQLYPQFWNNQKLLKLDKTAIGNAIVKDLEVSGTHTSMSQLLKGGRYYLADKINVAHRKNDADKNATDKEIIKLDEKANIWWSLVNGQLLKMYPKQGESNNKWFTGTDENAFVEQDTMILKMHQLYLNALRNAVKTSDYTSADELLQHIKNYQRKLGANIIPSQKRIDFEIKYNRSHVFFKLLIYFFSIGLLLFILAFFDLLQVFKSEKSKNAVKVLLMILTLLAIFGLLIHGTAMGIRWYIAGHAPWSNSYEITIFISFVTVLAGSVFSIKQSKLILAVAILFAALLLGIAHGNSMNPEMTNLVPVLKSYWLMIHVAVITLSYGFLGLGALLGFVVLLLYAIRTKNNKKRIENTIDDLTKVNELTLTVGLYALTIGTFLGGVWANESWGLYWSWDPKEVWSLISMMVYVFILHMRLVPGLKGKFTFNLFSLFSIATLIMTLYGVNYYLSGMHSYATGDPVPIQTWMYFAVAFFIIFSSFSYWRFVKFKKNM